MLLLLSSLLAVVVFSMSGDLLNCFKNEPKVGFDDDIAAEKKGDGSIGGPIIRRLTRRRKKQIENEKDRNLHHHQKLTSLASSW